MKHCEIKKRDGFTIVELLVVIVIIGILAAVSFTAYSSVQRTARDNKRRVDIVSLQTELEKYYAKNGVYPSSAYSANGQVSLASDKLQSNISLPQLQAMFPSLQNDFGDPSRRNETIFRSPQLEATPTYLYIGSVIYSKGSGSASSTISQTIYYKDGKKHVCDFTYNFSASTPDDKTVTSYVLGYYSEVQKKYIFIHGRQGMFYLIATNWQSDYPCTYSDEPSS